jgi:hypothetical protein
VLQRFGLEGRLPLLGLPQPRLWWQRDVAGAPVASPTKDAYVCKQLHSMGLHPTTTDLAPSSPGL